jgi:hypothetical protein
MTIFFAKFLKKRYHLRISIMFRKPMIPMTAAAMVGLCVALRAWVSTDDASAFFNIFPSQAIKQKRLPGSSHSAFQGALLLFRAGPTFFSPSKISLNFQFF